MRDSGVRVRIGARGIVAVVAVFLLAAFARTARAQSAAGTVSSASGQVQIQRGGATLAATPGTPVNRGDKIVSGADGHGVIILTDRSKLEISPSTTITLDQYITGGATPTRVGLASGTLRSVVNGTPRAPANYQVHTPNAIVTVRGTDFYTAYTQSSPELGNLPGISHYTEVDVTDGTVNLAQAAAPDSGVDVEAGTSGTVAGDKPPWYHKRKFPKPCDCDRDCEQQRDRDRDRERDCHRDCRGNRACDRVCEEERDRDQKRERDCRRDCDRDRDRDGNCKPTPHPHPTPK